MSESHALDAPSMGPVRFSFGDPAAGHWAGVILAGAFILVAGLVALVLALEPPRKTIDLLGIAGFAALLVVLGVAVGAYSWRSLARPAEWHVTETHVYRERGGRVLQVHELCTLQTPKLQNMVRFGQLISVWVIFSRKVILCAPTQDVAREIYALWAAAQQRHASGAKI